jgi:hypothetical protein
MAGQVVDSVGPDGEVRAAPGSAGTVETDGRPSSPRRD